MFNLDSFRCLNRKFTFPNSFFFSENAIQFFVSSLLWTLTSNFSVAVYLLFVKPNLTCFAMTAHLFFIGIMVVNTYNTR